MLLFDIFEMAFRVLTLATNGITFTQIMVLHDNISKDRIRWLLDLLLENNLLEIDSSQTYWTTLNGIKLREIRHNIEQILGTEKSLV
jgi:predicted transcriptional regulator